MPTAGDRNPVNASTCPARGPYSGLICTRCVTSLPARTLPATAPAVRV
ncbi:MULTISPECIES: hypothetical protein [unclassified Frankia]|nr:MULTISPECIES: hypothetical protein [unclassified Frankia]